MQHYGGLSLSTANARNALIAMSLTLTTGLLGFFLVAPAAGYPLQFDDSMRVLQILLPVFLGYLGSATTFAFRSNTDADRITFEVQ